MAVGASFTLKVTHKGIGLEKFKNKVRKVKIQISSKGETIGYRIAEHISEVINRSRRRKGKTSSGGLASAFRDRNMVKVKFMGDIINIGVGNKKLLNTQYPYWKIIDKGGFIPSATFGFFGHGGERGRPNSAYAGTGVGIQLWNRREWGRGMGGIFLLKPKNPIPPMNYIGKTKAWTNIQWNTKWKKEIIDIIKRK